MHTDQLPSFAPDARGLGDLELLLTGGYAPLDGFLGSADAAAVARTARLADGTPWPVPITLAVPDGTAGPVELTDPEGTPLARLDVAETWRAPDGRLMAGGRVSALRPIEHGSFRRLRLTPDGARKQLGDGPVVAGVVTGPPRLADLDRLRAEAGRLGARTLVLVAGDDVLVRSVLAARPYLPADALIVPLPPSTVDESVELQARVAAAYGATDLADRILGAPAEHPPEVAAVLAAAHPPPERRGVVVFFTGLSGSGKSTVARALHDALVEDGRRTVTLLDGDVVRRLLSAGLTFSRADRDLNIARIGYVGAEIARHGGIAICAPIAPYAAARAEVRARVDSVGDFVLVHVATPLEVCEARDRKGLYAKARAGLIPEFTGVSDPYEVPVDADLTIDTATVPQERAAADVLQLLTERGYLGGVIPAWTGG